MQQLKLDISELVHEEYYTFIYSNHNEEKEILIDSVKITNKEVSFYIYSIWYFSSNSDLIKCYSKIG